MNSIGNLVRVNFFWTNTKTKWKMNESEWTIEWKDEWMNWKLFITNSLEKFQKRIIEWIEMVIYCAVFRPIFISIYPFEMWTVQKFSEIAIFSLRNPFDFSGYLSNLWHKQLPTKITKCTYVRFSLMCDCFLLAWEYFWPIEDHI